MNNSEAENRPEAELESEPLKLTFTPMQIRAALEAGRVQEISQKYIDGLNEKILVLTNQTIALRKEAASTDAEIKKIKDEADSVNRLASDSYAETLNLIISEHGKYPPPWRATVLVEGGIPIGMNLIKE